jgi:uncharacterized protein (DUF1015 family)
LADISATAAILYTAAAGDASCLLAPPYDVIDDDHARRLREASGQNAVGLILPEGDPPGRYELAANRLAHWLDLGILAPAEHDALYTYRQEFNHDGDRISREALLAAVELSDFDEGKVLPHETTHHGPKVDRLALMTACRAQLSPIFFIARDPDRGLGYLVDQTRTSLPILEATTEDGIKHEVRRVPADLIATRRPLNSSGNSLSGPVREPSSELSSANMTPA